MGWLAKGKIAASSVSTASQFRPNPSPVSVSLDKARRHGRLSNEWPCTPTTHSYTPAPWRRSLFRDGLSRPQKRLRNLPKQRAAIVEKLWLNQLSATGTRRFIYGLTTASTMHVLLADFSSFTNPASPFRESQRDSVTQPSGCRVGEATLGLVGHGLPTPTGLRHIAAISCCNPVGVEIPSATFPQGSSCLATAGLIDGIPLGFGKPIENLCAMRSAQQLGRGKGGPISHYAGSETGASLELRPLGFPWALGIGPWSL